MMNDNNIKRLTAAGLMCAIVVITTMFAAVPIPNVAGAYANAGDAAVYAAAFLLGWPWGVAAAAIGSALADLLLGSAVYAPATLIIKGLMALIAARFAKKTAGAARIGVLALAGLVMAAGYFCFECVLYGFATAAISIPANLIQAALGALLGSVVIHGIEILHK